MTNLEKKHRWKKYINKSLRNAGFEVRRVFKQQNDHAIKNLNYSTNEHTEIHPTWLLSR